MKNDGWTKERWKKIAIGSIILNLLIVVAFKGLMDIGAEIIQKEEDCGILCGNMEAEAYNFDSDTAICYCLTDNEVIYQERIG